MEPTTTRFSPARLRAAMADRISVPELAELTGLTRETIYHYWRGRREPQGYAIVAIARALGRQVEWFYPDDKEHGDG